MKMSSFAFSVWDGSRKPLELSKYQRKQAIRYAKGTFSPLCYWITIVDAVKLSSSSALSCREEVPLLEHFCYCFSFLGLLFGPFILYNDHKRFMINPPKSINYRLVSSSEHFCPLLSVCALYTYVYVLVFQSSF